MGDFEAKHFYKVAEVAALFDLTRPTIYKEIKAGRLKAYVIAGEYRIPTSALEELAYIPEPEPEESEENEPMKEAAPAAILTEEEREQRKEKIKKAHEFNNYINETHPEEQKGE